jgi:hypothetical protein
VNVPATPVCRACGAPAERGQEFCLECGNRLVPARRAPTLAAWIVPSIVMLAVAAAGAAASIAATHGKKTHSSHAAVALSPLHPAPPLPVAARSKRSTKTTSKLIAWPSTNGYTIVLATIPLSQGAVAARSQALSAVKDGLQQVGVLVSSSYPSLQPGYYIVFSGIFPSLADAQSSLDTAKSSFPSAYARPIVR